jgi:acetyl esterase/lipase
MSVNTKLLLVVVLACIILLALAIRSTSFQLFIVNQLAALKGFERDAAVAYGKLPRQNLDIYRPQKNTKTHLPVVIFFYGGCWGACNGLHKRDYAFVAEAFSSNDMLAVVVDYREYPEVNFPTIMEDAKNAVEWVAKNINAYGGNPNKLFLMGHSAGAHIASMLAVDRQHLSQHTYEKLRGFIGLAGPYNFLPFDEDYMPILFASPMTEAESQPIHFVNKQLTIPFLLLHGANDTRVKIRNTETMATAIQQQGGDAIATIYPNTDHASIISAFSVIFRDKKPVFADVKTFIEKNSL